MGNPSNQKIFPHFNIELLRNVTEIPEPAIVNSVILGGMIGEMDGEIG